MVGVALAARCSLCYSFRVMIRPRFRLLDLRFSDIGKLVLFVVMLGAPLALLVSCDLTPSPTGPRGLPTDTALGRVVVEDDGGTPVPGVTRIRSGGIPTITPTDSPTPTDTPGTPLPTNSPTATFTPFVTPTHFITPTPLHAPPTVTPRLPPSATPTVTVPAPPPELTETPTPTEELETTPRPKPTPTEEG